MRALIVLLICTRCAAETIDLDLRSRDGGEAPVEPEQPACQVGAGLAEKNLEEMTELGFILSTARVSGRLSEAVRREDGSYRAELDITRVHYGISTLEGTRTGIILSEEDKNALQLPGDYIVGFNQNLAPYTDLDGQKVWWSQNVIAPSGDRYAEVLGYNADHTPIVTTARIVESAGTERVLEVTGIMAGPRTLPNVPFRVRISWTEEIYPAPGDQEYIVSFTDILEVFGGLVGGVLDFRPATQISSDEVALALLSAKEQLDKVSILERAHEHLVSYSFHRSPSVMRVQTAGFADECCTGAGGTYVREQVETTLRGPAGHAELYTGGHGFQSTASCGDRWLYGFEELAERTPVGPFTCDMSSSIGPDVWPTTALHVSLPMSEENETKVNAWLAASRPVYALRPELDTATAYDPTSRYWSEPLSVRDALATGALISIRVVATNGDEVTVESTFGDPSFGGELYRAKLNDDCIDPRLHRLGAEYLAPLVTDAGLQRPFDDEEVRRAAPLLIPGVLLPNLEWIRRSSSAYGTELRR
jgi:hypothetical protein